MKRLILNTGVILGIVLLVFSCNRPANNNATKSAIPTGITKETLDPIFLRDIKIEGLEKFFTGTVSVNPMLGNDENNEYSIANVIFAPTARANWHKHPKGQVLLVLDGEGFYQEKGKPAQPITKGDVVNIPPYVDHWHGATAGSKMVHVAITNYKDGENVFWGNPVTDKEYNSVAAQ